MSGHQWARFARRTSMIALTAAFAMGFAACNDDDDPIKEGCSSNKDCNDGFECSKDRVCVPIEGPDPVCGDGVVQAGEQCDEGTAGNDGETCNADCTLPPKDPVCGNGDVEEGEACDEGAEGNDGVTCTEDCQIPDPVCGNGRVEEGEACDEGEARNDGDSCNADCTLPAPTTGYVRWNSLTIVEPALRSKGGTPEAPTCDDFGWLVATVIDGLIGTPDEDTKLYALSILQEIEIPLTGESFMHFPECEALDPEGTECTLEDAPLSWETAASTASGACFGRIPATAGANGWVDHPENALAADAIPSNADGACIEASTEGVFNISLLGFDIPLNGVSMAYERSGKGDVMELPKGMLRGFVTTEAAEGLDFLGVTTLAALLSNGEGACDTATPLDVGPDGAGGTTSGWWFYVTFDASSVDVLPAP